MGRKAVNLHEAKAHFSELVERAEAGEEIVIARSGKPAARLMPLAGRSERRPGGWEGRVWISPDFDASDDLLAELLVGRSASE
jgi:prevent-host-death family protein